MVMRWHYACPDCPYEAELVGGFGDDQSGEWATVWCRACAELDDVLTRCQRLVVKGEGSFYMDHNDVWVLRKDAGVLPIRCPRSAAHRVELWNDSRPVCPKCDGRLRRSALPSNR